MAVMETTTCFGLCWPSSGCLGNLKASYMHSRARGVEISTYAPDDGQHRPKHVVVSITVIKYTSVIKLCLTTYLLLRIKDISRENQSTFFIISCSILLRIKKLSNKVVEKFETYIVCSIIFFYFDFYEIICKDIVERDGPQMTIWRIRIACWISKAKNTHSSCVILIVFPLQQWLHESASLLRYITLTVLFEACLDARWNGL